MSSFNSSVEIIEEDEFHDTIQNNTTNNRVEEIIENNENQEVVEEINEIEEVNVVQEEVKEEETLSPDELYEKALKLKETANNYYKEKKFDYAIQAYSRAIDLCPTPYEEPPSEDKNNIEADSSVMIYPDHVDVEKDMKYRELLASCHCNRAATYMNEVESLVSNNKKKKDIGESVGNKEEDDEAKMLYEFIIDDCSEALRWKPDYEKALWRRLTAYKALEKFEEGLADAREIKKNNPSYPKIDQTM